MTEGLQVIGVGMHRTGSMSVKWPSTRVKPVGAFIQEVREGSFPDEAHSYSS